MRSTQFARFATRSRMAQRRIPQFPGLYREKLSDGGRRFRIVISHHREILQKYFYFHDASSEGDALDRAKVEWTEIRRSIPVLTPRQNAQIERRKTKSGIVGVRRVTKFTKGHPYDYWIAVWSDGRGGHHSRTFSIHKYGEENARKRALKARIEALAELR